MNFDVCFLHPSSTYLHLFQPVNHFLFVVFFWIFRLQFIVLDFCLNFFHIRRFFPIVPEKVPCFFLIVWSTLRPFFVMIAFMALKSCHSYKLVHSVCVFFSTRFPLHWPPGCSRPAASLAVGRASNPQLGDPGRGIYGHVRLVRGFVCCSSRPLDVRHLICHCSDCLPPPPLQLSLWLGVVKGVFSLRHQWCFFYDVPFVGGPPELFLCVFLQHLSNLLRILIYYITISIIFCHVIYEEMLYFFIYVYQFMRFPMINEGRGTSSKGHPSALFPPPKW